MKKTTDAQKRATVKWRKNNKEKLAKANALSSARYYVRLLDSVDKLKSLKIDIDNRIKELED